MGAGRNNERAKLVDRSNGAARMIIQPVSGTIQQLNRGKARATYIGRVSKTWLTWLRSIATKGTDNNTFLSPRPRFCLVARRMKPSTTCCHVNRTLWEFSPTDRHPFRFFAKGIGIRYGHREGSIAIVSNSKKNDSAWWSIRSFLEDLYTIFKNCFSIYITYDYDARYNS